MQDIGPPRNWFAPLGQGVLIWSGGCALGNDVFLAVYNTGIVKQTNATGNFVPTGISAAAYWGMASFAGDIFVGIRNSNVGKIPGGSGTSVTLTGWGAKDWRAFAVNTSGTLLYLSARGYDICTWNGTTFSALGAGALTWHGMAPLGADMFAVTDAGATYKRTGDSGAFALVNSSSFAFSSLVNVNGVLIAGITGAGGPLAMWSGSSWALMPAPQNIFYNPRGLVVNSRGDLYVADAYVDIYRKWGRKVPS